MATIEVFSGNILVSVPHIEDEPIFSLTQRISKELGEDEQKSRRRMLVLNGEKLEEYQKANEIIRVLSPRLAYYSFEIGEMQVFLKSVNKNLLRLHRETRRYYP
ncbi:hypothetical protein BGX26_010129 [Mortierella sp. AD094]|nr:hypothetical protein BGX26_010129 [Mortierella sp. AD094]